jgi:cyanate permease
MSSHTERTLPELLQGAVGNIEEIVRSEFQLQKAEIKESTAKLRGPVTLLGVGFTVSLYAVGFLLLAAVYKLSTMMEAWMAALLVGGLLAIVAIITLIGATTKLKHVKVAPEKTVDTMKENIAWAKRQMK